MIQHTTTPTTFPALYQEREKYWSQLFDLSLLQGVTGVWKRFDYFFTTNGVKCGFVCTRPKRRNDNDEFLDTDNGNVVAEWGGDPGVRSLLVLSNSCTLKETRSPLCIIDFKASLYHHLCHHNLTRKHRNERLDNDSEILELERNITINKTMNAQQYVQHLQTCLPGNVFRRLVTFNSMNRLDLWRSFKKRKSTLDQFANHIWRKSDVEDKKSVIIAYGDAVFSHSMRGNAPVPTKTLKNTLARHLTLIPTSEYRTSQICSHLCTDEYEKMTNAIEQDTNDRIYAVKFCNNCRTFWNRDVNASRNILYRNVHQATFHCDDQRFART